jgi:hypothetical protein
LVKSDRPLDFEMPAEVWSHVLSFVSDFHDAIMAKRVSRLFYSEVKLKKILLNIPGVKWDESKLLNFI